MTTTNTTTIMTASSLLDLPVEIVHQILLHLDTSDLLQISRTSRQLRRLALDPVLHQHRLRHASYSLAHLLDHRLSRCAISPPQAWIFLSKTNVLSRSISKSLIKIRLSHSLCRRPSVESLIEKAILPSACTNRSVSPIIIRQQDRVSKSLLRDRLGRKLERRPSVRNLVELNIIPQECVRVESDGQGRERRKWINVSPRFVEVRRKVIRESLKDGLRAWVERKGWREQKRREGQWEDYSAIGVDGQTQGARSVKALVRRMTARHRQDEDRCSLSSISTSTVNTTSGTRSDPRISLEKKRAQIKWGRDREMQKEKEEKMRVVLGCGSEEIGKTRLLSSQPTRAHVLGLRTFWEGVIKAAAVP